MTMEKSQGEKIRAIEVCRDRGNFLLLAHAEADGDAIGSLLGLGLSLQRAGKNVIMVSPDGVPLVYRFLPDWRKIRSGGGQLSYHEAASLEVIVTLDTATLERLGKWSGIVNEGSHLVLNIDHHLTNSRYGDINWIEEASSTGELVLALLSELGWELKTDVALCLYTALVTDTGSFRYENTSSITHQNAARLLQTGINPAQVTQHIYESKPAAAVRLLGRALETLELSSDGRIAYLTVSKSALTATGAAAEDLNGIVNHARGIAGVDVGILFQETDAGVVKVSLRSGPRIDVSEIAQKFGGGGHPRAAGCRIQGPLGQVQQAVLDCVAAVLARRGPRCREY